MPRCLKGSLATVQIPTPLLSQSKPVLRRYNVRRCREQFNEFDIETELQTLRRGGVEIHLAKRPFDVLLFLIENRGRVVSRDELLNIFWEGHEVYDDALRKCIGAIRKALDDTEKSPRFIETRRGSGYRFVGSLSEDLDAAEISNLKSGNGDLKAEISNLKFRNGDFKSEISDFRSQSGEPASSDVKKSGNFGFLPRMLFAGAIAAVLTTLVILGLLAFRQGSDAATKSLGEAVPARRSIAILPIRNLTGDAANEYLSDGITESLINEVSRTGSLKVISRSSAFQFKNKDVSAQEIGAKLGVETILEGGLRQSGEQLRVEVRLVNTKDGSVMWASDSEEKKLADIFVMQESVTCQILSELKVKPCVEVPREARFTQNAKAYQLYLQGLYYRNLITNDNLQRAIGFYDEALRVEPGYALAHEGLATAYMALEFNSGVTPGAAAPKAEFHAQKALDLDAELAGAYIVLGAVKTMKNYDLRSRENYYKQALVKNPNHRTAHLWLANNYTVQGKFDEAEREILYVQEIDPLSSSVRLHLTELYYYWRKSDKSIEQAEMMLAGQPENNGIFAFLARAYAQKGDFEKAFAALERLAPGDGTRVMVLAANGRRDEALKITEAVAASDEANKNPYWVGCLYATIGERDKAFEWLEKSYAMRQADLVSIKIDPSLDSLRDDSRYIDLLRRVNLEE